MLGSSSLLMLPKPVLLDSRCRCLLVAMSVLVQADGAVLIVVDDLKDTPPRLASVTPDRPDKAKRPKLESGTPDGASTKLESAMPDGASPSSSHLSPEPKEVMRREALGPLWAAPRDDPPVVPDWSAMSISPPSVSKEVVRHESWDPRVNSFCSSSGFCLCRLDSHAGVTRDTPAECAQGQGDRETTECAIVSTVGHHIVIHGEGSQKQGGLLQRSRGLVVLPISIAGSKKRKHCMSDAALQTWDMSVSCRAKQCSCVRRPGAGCPTDEATSSASASKASRLASEPCE